MTTFLKLTKWNMIWGTFPGATQATINPGFDHGDPVWVNMDMVTQIIQIADKANNIVYTCLEYPSATHDDFGGTTVQEEPTIILQLLNAAKHPFGSTP